MFTTFWSRALSEFNVHKTLSDRNYLWTLFCRPYCMIGYWRNPIVRLSVRPSVCNAVHIMALRIGIQG